MKRQGTYLIEPDDGSDGYVDPIAVEAALKGRRVGLTRTERCIVAHALKAAGHKPGQIQWWLGCGPSTTRALLADTPQEMSYA